MLSHTNKHTGLILRTPLQRCLFLPTSPEQEADLNCPSVFHKHTSCQAPGTAQLDVSGASLCNVSAAVRNIYLWQTPRAVCFILTLLPRDTAIKLIIAPLWKTHMLEVPSSATRERGRLAAGDCNAFVPKGKGLKVFACSSQIFVSWRAVFATLFVKVGHTMLKCW